MIKFSEKVLVIGDDSRSFLSTVRSLGRQGIEVHAAPFDFRSPALLSRYISKVHFLPYYLDGGADWLVAMTILLRNENFTLVIPCDERALLPLCLHRDELSTRASLAIPSATALDIFFDKVKTRELAQSVGVPVAAGRLMQTDDTVHSVMNDIGLPVVVKQPKSYALPDLYVRASTSIIHDEKVLAACLNRRLGMAEPILFEQMFEGVGVGISVLCRDGAILQAFEHHRAHELDGSSYYRRSAPLDPERLAAVARMAAATAYTGLAMFEFKVNAGAGTWILIEVNARPWGSLPLPVSIGVDFPHALYRLIAKDEVVPAIDYPANRYGRNLILDFWQARVQAGAFARKPVKLLFHWAHWAFGFRRLLTGCERHDACVLDDLRPGLKELSNLVAGRAKAISARVSGERTATGALARHLAARAASPGPSIHIIFVCQGNINRSSYAEFKARQVFAGLASGCTFASAGMLPRNQRPSPAIAVEVAAEHGVDMSAHLSRHAAGDMLRQADLVIAFDKINLASIAARYPELGSRVFLLGDLLPARDAPSEIPDPDGGTATVFRSTFRTIDACIEEFARIVQARRIEESHAAS